MLSQIIADIITEKGPISFAEYMDLALYYPGKGYYTRDAEKLGRNGDFFTAPTYSPLFGFLIAKQLEEMWNIMAEEDFTVVEYGAGTGHLCKAILDYFRQHAARKGKLPGYYIIEKSPSMIAEAKKIVPPSVKWISDISEVSGFHGCVLSNELLDNFPVHRVQMHNTLQEIVVGFSNTFTEQLVPADDQLQEYFADLKISLAPGTKAEVNLQAGKWMSEVAKHLARGYVLTIDYGYPAGELLEPHRKDGTVTCYNRHRVNYALYSQVGEQDITSHVNFSALALYGRQHGLHFTGFTDQRRFLTALGFHQLFKECFLTGNDYNDFHAERTLTSLLLSEMGYKFKVLIQQKDVKMQRLRGLSLA